MILGDAEQHEILGPAPIRVSEFPKGAAESVKPARGHVYRTESAMRGEIGRAELHRPVPRQRLALIAAGKESELARIRSPNTVKPRGRDSQGFVPRDFLEFPRAARPRPFHRSAEPCRRAVLHDSGAAFAANHAFVHGMVPVAFNIPYLAVPDMDIDSASASAHVAGGFRNGISDRSVQFEFRFDRHSNLIQFPGGSGLRPRDRNHLVHIV